MNKLSSRLTILTAAGALIGCAETPKASPPQPAPTLEISAPAGAGCYRSDPSRDRTLRSHLIAMQQGELTRNEAVEAIKLSVENAGFPFNQVPAAESAAAYALSGGDLDAWEQAYLDYAEPGETDRTSFLNSLCWV